MDKKTALTDFNHTDWLARFSEASRNQDGFRELRKEIFSDTVRIVRAGAYSINGMDVTISNDGITEKTILYRDAFRMPDPPTRYQTAFSVINADCLETANVLLKAGKKPCVLNMASRQNPGGGVFNGAGAQEENLFRRTNLFLSLYQFADFAEQYDIHRSKDSYPLDRDFGGVYSPGITVFRGSEANGYCLLSKPYMVSVVSVPAVNHPDLERGSSGAMRIAQPHIEATKNKIRTIFRIAAAHSHDALVLGAFGCGAFANPPRHIAEIFREVFSEDEFIGQFETVVFSIIDDHNSRKAHNPHGNVLPFLEVFGS